MLVNRLPAIIPFGTLTTLTGTPSGPGADRWRPAGGALHRLLHRQRPQPDHRADYARASSQCFACCVSARRTK